MSTVFDDFYDDDPSEELEEVGLLRRIPLKLRTIHSELFRPLLERTSEIRIQFCAFHNLLQELSFRNKVGKSRLSRHSSEIGGASGIMPGRNASLRDIVILHDIYGQCVRLQRCLIGRVMMAQFPSNYILPQRWLAGWTRTL